MKNPLPSICIDDDMNSSMDRNGLTARGEFIQLAGWNLANWLLWEGRYWNLSSTKANHRTDILSALQVLAGNKSANHFLKQYRETYITREDLVAIAGDGSNCIRIPLSASFFLIPSTQNDFSEDSFRFIDGILKICQSLGLYVILALQADPAIQTENAADHSDDGFYRCTPELWTEIARHFAGNSTIAAFDLLGSTEESQSDFCLPKCLTFYSEAARCIHEIDPARLMIFSDLSGGDDSRFAELLSNSCSLLSFQLSGGMPDPDRLLPYVRKGQMFGCPLIMYIDAPSHSWLCAMAMAARQHGISVIAGPWKQMEPAPRQIQPPAHWDILDDALSGIRKPEPDQIQQILTGLLGQIRTECCQNHNDSVYFYRQPGCQILGTDFDALPGMGKSYWASRQHPDACFRNSTGMDVYIPESSEIRAWQYARLRLHPDEWASFTVYKVTSSTILEIKCYAETVARLEITQDGTSLGVFDLSCISYAQTLADIHLYNASESILKITLLSGTVSIDRLLLFPPHAGAL